MCHNVCNVLSFGDVVGQFFEGIDWGTDKVLQQQIETGKKLGIKLKLLSTQLNDVVRLFIHPSFHSFVHSLS